MNLKNLFYVFFIFLCFFAEVAFANDNCDMIICKGSTLNTPSPDYIDRMSRLGINVSGEAPIPAPVDSVANPRIRIPESAPPSIDATSITNVERRTGGNNSSATAPNPVAGDTTTPGETQQANNNPSNGGSSGGGANSASLSPPTAPSSAMTNSGAQVIGQHIYSDENDGGEDDNKIDSNTNAPKGMKNNLASTPTPNPGGGKKKRDVASATSLPAVSGDGSQGDGSSPIGNYNSGSRSAAKNSVAASAAEEALKKLDKGGYFGASGGSSPKVRGQKGSSSPFKKGQSIAKFDKFGNPINYKDVLQRRLLRNLASTGQLSKKQDFLFYSMCKHYDSYEKSNNINYGRSQCPSKK